jgi:AcrR family transcriptional regulator
MIRTNDKERKQLDPAKTRADILEAALLLFAERGYSGTSIADMASKANVPKSLVQYHFGSKSDLWQACLKHCAAPMIEALDRHLAGQGELDDLLRTRIRIHLDHPELGRLIAWASIEPVPLPGFIVERRQALAETLLSHGGPGHVRRMLAALASIDGWFLFRNLYGRVAGDEIVASMTEEHLMTNAKRLLSEP